MAKNKSKAAPAKKGAASSKKAPAKKATAPRTAPAVKRPDPAKTAELANMSEAIRKIRKEWPAKGQAWTKKFELPSDNEVHAMSVLFAKINYGKIKISQLD